MSDAERAERLIAGIEDCGLEVVGSQCSVEDEALIILALHELAKREREA